MKLRSSYDWVVLGDDPGALLSAGLASRLGLSVLVVDSPQDRAKSKISKNDQLWDPELNCLVGLGETENFPGVWYRCLRRLGLSDAEKHWIQPTPSEPDLLFPGLRMRWRNDLSQLKRELDREFGATEVPAQAILEWVERARSPVLSYWSQSPERMTWAALPDGRLRGKSERGPSDPTAVIRALQKVRARVPLQTLESGKGEILRSAIWNAFSSGQGPDLGVERWLNLASLSPVSAGFRGGLGQFREHLKNLAMQNGAHVPEGLRARRIFIEEGRLVGVQLQSRGSVIGAQGGVVGCALDQIQEQASVSGRSWLRRFREAPQATSWRFTLALTVEADAVPVGAATRMIWSEAGAPPLEIEVVDPLDRGISQSRHRIIFLRTLVPFSPESLAPAYQRRIAGRMFRQLTEVMPFLEFHVVRIYPDFRDDSDDDFRGAHPFSTLVEVPVNLRAGLRSGLGTRTGIEGLFVVSPEAFPELGSLGTAFAALEATAWIAHRSGIAGPLS
jgi:phytoene dehydrogenase-like protein